MMSETKGETVVPEEERVEQWVCTYGCGFSGPCHIETTDGPPANDRGLCRQAITPHWVREPEGKEDGQ